MADTFHLEILTPDGIIYSDEVDEAIIPTTKGLVAILPHHVPLYSKLAEGETIIKKGGKEKYIAVLGGILEVGKNKVSILSDYAVPAESIIVAHALEAKKRAEIAQKEKQNETDFQVSNMELRKSILELKVARNIKRSNTSQ